MFLDMTPVRDSITQSIETEDAINKEYYNGITIKQYIEPSSSNEKIEG